MPEYFRKFLRQQGINLYFLFIFSIFWAIYNAILVVEHRPETIAAPSLPDTIKANTGTKFIDWLRLIVNVILQDIGLYQFSYENLEIYGLTPTLWLLLVRIYAFLVVDLSLKQAICMLSTTPPDTQIDHDQGTDHKSIKETCPKLHCLCIRIVTRGHGRAPKFVYKAVGTAVMLVSKMCRYERLKVHLVTETPFLDDSTRHQWLNSGATEVHELVVPPNYTTPKGTMYKARNIHYWQGMGGVGLDCDESRSWILSLDEEAVITKSMLFSFIKDLLGHEDEAKIGYALAPAIIDVKTGSVGFLNKIMEARWMAHHFAFLKAQASSSQGTLAFHGGAFFARASVDREMGNDFGPEPSVAEDFATGILANEKKVAFKYLHGWFIENTAETLRGFIRHRARVLRGQFYCVFFMPMNKHDTFRHFHRLAIISTYPFLHLLLASLIMSFPSKFHPAGPRCIFLDLCFVFTMTVQATCFVFGAAYMEMTRNEMIGCLLITPFMVLIGVPIIDGLVIVEAIRNIFSDMRARSVSFQVTRDE